jgi:BASS family bile acid:Na+ symporter
VTPTVNLIEVAFRLSVVVFIAGSLGGVGLGLTARDAFVPLTHLRFVVPALVASWLMTPAVAWLLVQMVPLEPPYAAGILLLALAPCAPFAPLMVQRARGDAAYLAAFMVLSAVSTVVVMPLAVPLLIDGLSADPWAIARPLLLFVLGPLLVGMAVRGANVRAAEHATPAVARITSLAGGVALLLMVVLYGRGIVGAVGSFAIATQVAFLFAITVAAHLLGAGLPDEQRAVLTLGTCTRNLGAALAPLAAGDFDQRAVVVIAIAGPVTLIAAAITARWLERRGRPRRLAAYGGA